MHLDLLVTGDALFGELTEKFAAPRALSNVAPVREDIGDPLVARGLGNRLRRRKDTAGNHEGFAALDRRPEQRDDRRGQDFGEFAQAPLSDRPFTAAGHRDGRWIQPNHRPLASLLQKITLCQSHAVKTLAVKSGDPQAEATLRVVLRS
ncbi:hypothetical protein CLG85_016160 [Yangia mangrovi]|uniref:Uncharacterized protein n=1 Tax=Alloyangia mangrovi TaxID=1779329 RepID=A0ABT2KNW4_9RHOB|nr:hypothetical protein [Alloyangia mangrovi]MCT4371768.1 hypothetical protein [Alloyangia mangrovi]